MTQKSTEFLENEASERVPLKEKLSYGFAQMPGTFYGGVMGVIQSFYFAWMGLLNIWIIIAQISSILVPQSGQLTTPSKRASSNISSIIPILLNI